MIADFHFLRPEMLIALIPLGLTWWLLWRGQDSFRRMQRFVDPHLLEHLVIDQADRHRFKPVHLLAPVWLIAVIALAGPAWEKEPAPFSDDNAGLFIILKNSESMNSTDVQPSRLARAKQKIHDLLSLRDQMSSGLIVYSGSAHLVMPLTRDGSIINTMIEDLTPDLMPLEGDALVDALLLAQQSVERSAVPASILILADSVSAAEVDALKNADIRLPVQILVLHSPAASVNKGLTGFASTVGAQISMLTVDDADVRQIASNAVSDIRAVAETSSGDRWRDAGYYLLVVIIFLSLAWSRRGWLVR